MSDWIGLGVIVLIVALALVGAARLGTRRAPISVEEFEERAREGGHARTGLAGLQGVFDPKAARAVAVRQDLKHGYYNKKRVPGEGDDGAQGNSPSVVESDRGKSQTESEERGDA